METKTGVRIIDLYPNGLRKTEMTPFAIIGMPRTGSTLLATGLTQHPQAVCYGELLHPVRSEREFTHYIELNSDKIFYSPEDDAIDFIKKFVLNSHLQQKAVGFKLFGEYAQGPGSEKLFARIKDELPSLYLIHIKRHNYLEVLTSRETAKITKNWVEFTDDHASSNDNINRETITLEISPDTAEIFFENMKQVDHFFEQHFRDNNYKQISYEDLSENFSDQMNQIYTFLNLDEWHAAPLTIKQNTNRISEKVKNYNQLKAHFSTTEFSKFFTD